MKNKKVIVMTTLLMAFVLLSIGTIAYFRRIVNGNVSASVGDLVLVVNEANAELNETFSVSLNRSEEEPFVLPDDKGTFNINIDSTGSGSDVYVTINIIRTNLPDNLKFYLDENYTNVLTSKTYTIAKSDSMTLSVPVYWFWDGSVDDENDSLFINEALEAQVIVTATTGLRTLYDTIMVNPTLDTDVDFGEMSTSTNGQGLMMREGTQNDEYPIVYYRGDVNNNNVIFDGFCWLIVRTTETGGIKLVFNGPINNSGGCNNYSEISGEPVNTNYSDVFVGKGKIYFNSNIKSPVYAGYMYNDTNRYVSGSIAYPTLDIAEYTEHLSDNTIDSETGHHTQNKYNSAIKEEIDIWYKSNILGKIEESLLEDTAWCNDRSVISETYSIENYATNNEFHFAAKTRLNKNATKTPNLNCIRDMDKFTVDSANGNGDLDYPIGLLTADEVNLSGLPFGSSGNFGYLRLKSEAFWTITPYQVYDCRVYVFMQSRNALTYSVADSSRSGIRPAISLKNITLISGGDGSYKQPYIVAIP